MTPMARTEATTTKADEKCILGDGIDEMKTVDREGSVENVF